MNNPYQSPTKDSPEDGNSQSPNRRPASWRVMVGLVFGAYVVAMFVAPVDPITHMIVTVPIAALALLGYYVGLIA